MKSSTRMSLASTSLSASSGASTSLNANSGRGNFRTNYSQSKSQMEMSTEVLQINLNMSTRLIIFLTSTKKICSVIIVRKLDTQKKSVTGCMVFPKTSSSLGEGILDQQQLLTPTAMHQWTKIRELKA